MTLVKITWARQAVHHPSHKHCLSYKRCLSLNDLPYIKFKTIKAAAQQMLTLAGDRFTEEEFNLGQFFFKIIIIQF